MVTDQLRVNQLSDLDFEWYLTYLAAIDARELDAYGTFLADSCTMHFNNVLAAQSKAEILANLGAYWQSYAALEHELLNIYGNGKTFMLEALNHYERLDGQKVTLRAVALTDRDSRGLVTSVRIYSDVAPLFAAS